MPSSSIFLHTCCGPCACYSTQYLREAGLEPTLFFYNPNIQPYQEQLRRWEALRELAELRKLPVVREPGYDLEGFLEQVADDPSNRCAVCYRIRLTRTAMKAKELGFQTFSTTLLISPYQNHQLLCLIGQELAAKSGLKFYDADLRPGFRESQRQAKELGLYRQGYCGCVYSEKERYYKA